MGLSFYFLYRAVRALEGIREALEALKETSGGGQER